ncbi:LysR family transcriptional regulator [Brevibacillus marinus]|uniref:LysR family transcriptional regulator n=1 Tax=Brevibacillus marinus TaxID=2496837 RepID=UPI000F8396B9|nr:LysR family transcriptional regulator [Brevibacillus marinus]
MNIENIEAFVYVVHYESFNKAAEALFLTQPSITSRIQSLERELNCLLFERVGKKILLTEKGKQFLPYAQHMLQSYQLAKLKLQEQKTLPNEMRIGCTLSASNYLIPKLIVELKKRYPAMQFTVVTASSEEILSKVLNGELDFGFVRKVTHPQIYSAKLLEDPIRLYTNENHPFVSKQQVSLEEVGQQSLVFFECGSLDWRRIHRLFENLDVLPRIEYQVDNVETAKKLVSSGAGIGFLPSICVQQEVQEKKLFPVHVPEISNIFLQTHVISLNERYNAFFQDLLEIGKRLD